jgi:hypothetical protein
MPKNVETTTSYFINERGDVVGKSFKLTASDLEIKRSLRNKYIKLTRPWAL